MAGHHAGNALHLAVQLRGARGVLPVSGVQVGRGDANTRLARRGRNLLFEQGEGRGVVALHHERLFLRELLLVQRAGATHVHPCGNVPGRVAELEPDI
ncbi:MAG: hypothetical protein E6H78_21625, partial [Betaproteobacteria bacterium]